MARFEIGLRTSGDDAELFRLYEEFFGAELTASSRRRWPWQYGANPHAEEGEVVWVGRRDATPVGQMATMPVWLWWGDKEVRASWGMDFFVRRNEQGRGLGPRLTRAWTDHVDAALAIGLTPPAYALYKRMGFKDVGKLPFFQKVVDPVAVARRRFGTLLGSLSGPFVAMGLRLIRPSGRSVDKTVAVAESKQFTAEYRGLWDRAKSSYAMCVRRDPDYLRWKYLDSEKPYTIWEARRDGALVGFAVSRIEDYRGLRIGWLIDVFAHASDHGAKGALIRAILDAFRHAGVARAQAFCLNRELQMDLRREGFFEGDSTSLFCVMAPDGSDDVFTDRDRWHVVFGDADMDR